MKKTNDVLIITSVSNARTETGQLQILDILKNYPVHINLVFAGLRPGSDKHDLICAALFDREFTTSYDVADITLVDTLLTALKGLRKHSRVFLNDANYCAVLPNFTHQKNWLGVSPIGIDQRQDYIMVGADADGKVLFAQEGSKVENTYAWTGLAYFESVNSVVNEIEHSASRTLGGHEGLAAAFTAANTLLSVILVQDWKVYWTDTKLRQDTKLGDPGGFTYEVSNTRRIFTFSHEADASKHVKYASWFARTRRPNLHKFGCYILQDTQPCVRAIDSATTPELIEFFQLLKYTSWEVNSSSEDALKIAEIPLIAAKAGVDYYRDNFDNFDIQTVNGRKPPKDLTQFFDMATRRIKETAHVCKVHGNLRIDNLAYNQGKIVLQDFNFKNTLDGYGDLYSEVAYLIVSLICDLEKLSRNESVFYSEREGGAVEVALPLHSRAQVLHPVISSLVDNYFVLNLHTILRMLALIKGQPESIARPLWACALADIALVVQSPELVCY